VASAADSDAVGPLSGAGPAAAEAFHSCLDGVCQNPDVAPPLRLFWPFPTDVVPLGRVSVVGLDFAVRQPGFGQGMITSGGSSAEAYTWPGICLDGSAGWQVSFPTKDLLKRNHDERWVITRICPN
jgi:hypothetical protein